MTVDPVGAKLVVSREGKVVTIEIRCVNLEDARTIYNEACAGAQGGLVVLEVGTVPRETINVP